MLLIVESPFAADNEKVSKIYAAYLDACLKDCLLNGHSPFAAHGLYTRPGVLDDNDPEQRALGINAGFYWREVASYTIFFTDLGWSKGMIAAKNHCERLSLPYMCAKLGRLGLERIKADYGVLTTYEEVSPQSEPVVGFTYRLDDFMGVEDIISLSNESNSKVLVSEVVNTFSKSVKDLHDTAKMLFPNICSDPNMKIDEVLFTPDLGHKQMVLGDVEQAVPVSFDIHSNMENYEADLVTVLSGAERFYDLIGDGSFMTSENADDFIDLSFEAALTRLKNIAKLRGSE